MLLSLHMLATWLINHLMCGISVELPKGQFFYVITLDQQVIHRRTRVINVKRQYRTKGPNHLWHIDGYDKLKPFGFCVHGAIDGYSRRIMWLEVGPSNNDPSIIAQYFVDCVRQIGGTPAFTSP